MNFNSLQTVDDIKLALVECDERVEMLRQELSSITSDEDTFSTQLDDLFDLLPGKLRPVLQDAQRLEEQLAKSSSLATSASFKVKELDLVRERVQEACRRVDDMMEAQRCAEGVGDAISRGDLEQAARFIGRYRQIQPLQAISPQVQQAAQEVEQKLRQQLQRAEQAALSSQADAPQVAEVCRICSLIRFCSGTPRDGAAAYTFFVSRRVDHFARQRRLQAERDCDSSSSNSNNNSETKRISMLASALSDVFESAAEEVTRRLPEATEMMSPETALSTLRAIEDGVGNSASALLEMCRKTTGVALVGPALVAASASGKKSTSVTKQEEAVLAHLDSISLLCSRVFLWRRFCAQRAAALNLDEGKVENYFVDSTGGAKMLESAVSQLAAEYVGLEEKFLLWSVQRAIEMDETDPDSMTGKMVDYVFFVLRVSCHRAVNTLAADAACAVINIAGSCLESFLDVSEQLLQAAANSNPLALSVGSSRDGGDRNKVPYAVALNNVAMSAEYIVRLKSELDQVLKKAFAGREKEISKLEACFSDLLTNAQAFRNSLATNLNQVSRALEPSIRDMTDLFNGASYVLAEKDYSMRQLEEESAWPVKLTVQLQDLMSPFRSSMLPSCWDALSKSVCVSVANRLERLVIGKKYNALGALQLTRDVSNVTHALIHMCPSCRGDVARLSQMCVALSVEQCSDLEELAAGAQWRLTPGESRRLLARRVEFTQEQIAKIKL